MKRLAIIVILFSILLCFFGCAIPKPPANEIIEDLAYVEVSPTPYSDDADPEDDGFAIDIVYYDSKSEPIHFTNIPVEVIIEIYGYKDTYFGFDHAEMEFICTKQATVDHSMKLSEIFGNYIRIPFESLPIDRSSYSERGTIKVTVITPKQGNFESIEDGVRLYPKS